MQRSFRRLSPMEKMPENRIDDKKKAKETILGLSFWK